MPAFCYKSSTFAINPRVIGCIKLKGTGKSVDLMDLVCPQALEGPLTGKRKGKGDDFAT